MKRYHVVFFMYYIYNASIDDKNLDEADCKYCATKGCDVYADDKNVAEAIARYRMNAPRFQTLGTGVMKYTACVKDMTERKNKMIDLTNVEASAEFEKLPVGGYVCVIMKATDHEADQYVEIVYDIAEGDKTGFYAQDEDWRHSTRKYYKGKAAGMFKAFVEQLAADNKGMNSQMVISGESVAPLQGCKFGALIQERYYTGNDGVDKTALEVAKTVACDKIRTNNYTLPAPRDNRKKDNVTVETINDGDVPFLM